MTVVSMRDSKNTSFYLVLFTHDWVSAVEHTLSYRECYLAILPPQICMNEMHDVIYISGQKD